MTLWQMIPTSDQIWLPPPVDLGLSSDEVHVWRASLNQSDTQIRRLQRTLQKDELSRVERFYFEKDRRHFIIAHGLLRAILSRHLEVKPDQVSICYSRNGKPFLEAEVGRPEIQFNLSHSEGLALFAVTCGREIGIDLERIRPIPEAGQISNRFFSERENAMLRSLSARLKEEAFFTLWARKEAFIKASGEGLSLHLDQFDASLALNKSATLLSAEDNSERASRWSLRQLTPAPGYVAALVVAGCDWRLRCWQFPEQTL